MTKTIPVVEMSLGAFAELTNMGSDVVRAAGRSGTLPGAVRVGDKVLVPQIHLDRLTAVRAGEPIQSVYLTESRNDAIFEQKCREESDANCARLNKEAATRRAALYAKAADIIRI